ncbi:SusD/RagB family nutrient-binding outer membrane lipoprotein [Flavitalea flava]
MKNYIKYMDKGIAAILFSGLMLSVSCKKYLDVNKDPNNPSVVSAANRLVGAITTSNGAAMWRGAREVAAITQYGCAKTRNNAETWRMTSAYFLMQNTYVWSMPNCVDMINLGRTEGSPVFMGAGETLLAVNFGLLTDQLGSIVVDDFYNGTSQLNLLPKFQDQQTVYLRLDSLLNAAISHLSETNNKTTLNSAGGDIIYKGDASKWKRFAWALKARYLNHLSKKTSLYNAQKIIEACSNAFNGDGMDAEFAHLHVDPNQNTNLDTDRNPWFSWGGFDTGGITDPNNPNYNPRYLSWSQFFVNMLTSFPVTNNLYTDPRIGKIMQPALSDGQYRGQRSGGKLTGGQGLLPDGQPGDATKTNANDFGRFSNSGFYTNETSATAFITYSEVKFIESEARLRSGDSPGALAAYEEGVKSNMRKMGVSVTDINTYWAAQLADGLNAHFSDLTQGLSHIMRQKYIALCLNPETWVDMRRADYSQDIYGPSLVRPLDLNSTVFTAPNQWILALCYESNEEVRNPAAILSAGGNTPQVRLLTPLWWDTAN